MAGAPDRMKRTANVQDAFGETSYAAEALRHRGVELAKPLQSVSWPLMLLGQDSILFAPKGSGKFISMLSMIVTHANWNSRVIFASHPGRLRELFNALPRSPHLRPLISDTPSSMVAVNVICCSFGAIPKIARSRSPAILVLDGIDRLAEQGYGSRLASILNDVARNRKALRVFATARTLSPITVDVARQIVFPVAVGMMRESSEPTHLCEERVVVCPAVKRFGVLVDSLKQRYETVVVIVVKDRPAANLLEEQLFESDM